MLPHPHQTRPLGSSRRQCPYSSRRAHQDVQGIPPAYYLLSCTAGYPHFASSWFLLYVFHIENKAYPIYIIDAYIPGSAQVFPQPGNKHVQAPAQKIIVLSPQLREDILASEDPVLIPEQIIQQFGLPGGKHDVFLSTDLQFQGVLMELYISLDDDGPIDRYSSSGHSPDNI